MHVICYPFIIIFFKGKIKLSTYFVGEFRIHTSFFIVKSLWVSNLFVLFCKKSYKLCLFTNNHDIQWVNCIFAILQNLLDHYYWLVEHLCNHVNQSRLPTGEVLSSSMKTQVSLEGGGSLIINQIVYFWPNTLSNTFQVEWKAF